MEGYLNMPEETAQSIRSGWFFTGDIARADEEGVEGSLLRENPLLLPPQVFTVIILTTAISQKWGEPS